MIINKITAIDDIINQIKGGRFTLKQTDVRQLFCFFFIKHVKIVLYLFTINYKNDLFLFTCVETTRRREKA